MKKLLHITQFLLFNFILIFCISCEKEVQLAVTEKVEQKLAVICNFSPDEPFFIELTKSQNLFGENNDNLILERDQHLLFLDDKTQKITPIKTPELLINQFLVTTETLYIYDSKILHEFQLKN